MEAILKCPQKQVMTFEEYSTLISLNGSGLSSTYLQGK